VSSGFQIFRKIAPVLLCIATLGPAAQAREVIRKGDTVIIPLRGEVSPALYLFLRRGIKAAESAEASAIVIEMNTYGGRLDSAEEITGALNRVTIPTYTFIDSNAGSAGALIALATKHIYMAPVSAIGAAAPVLSTGQDLPETERDKTISYFSALVRSMASRNGHNPDLGEAFMNKEKEVKIGDRVVHAKGSLLTLNAQEASEMINGKPLLADGIAQSIDDLAKKARLGGQLVRLQPTGFEQFAFWITALAPLLLLLGIVCAYLEFKIPGATLPGVVAGICFVSFSSVIIWPVWQVGKQRYFLCSALPSFSLKCSSSPTPPSSLEWSALSSFSPPSSGQWSIATLINQSFPRPRCCSSRC